MLFVKESVILLHLCVPHRPRPSSNAYSRFVELGGLKRRGAKIRQEPKSCDTRRTKVNSMIYIGSSWRGSAISKRFRD